MATIYINRGLRKDIRKGIEQRLYKQEEIQHLHEVLLKEYRNRKVGLKRAVIIIGSIFLIMFLLTAFTGPKNGMDLTTLFITFGVLAVMLVIIFFFLRHNMVELNKKQFLRSLEIGYPELLNRFGRESFE